MRMFKYLFLIMLLQFITSAATVYKMCLMYDLPTKSPEANLKIMFWVLVAAGSAL